MTPSRHEAQVSQDCGEIEDIEPAIRDTAIRDAQPGLLPGADTRDELPSERFPHNLQQKLAGQTVPSLFSISKTVLIFTLRPTKMRPLSAAVAPPARMKSSFHLRC